MSLTQLSQAPYSYNVVNNGGFTQYERDAEYFTQTADEFPGIIEAVDLEKYRLGQAKFRTATNALGFWDLEGADCRFVVAPTRADGTVIPSFDGGNLLRISFVEDGELIISQELPDIKRFLDKDLSVSISGVGFVSGPTVTAEFVTDTETVMLTAASSVSFGDYRRFGGHGRLPETMKSARFQLRINGCAGEDIGLSGVTVILGVRTNRVNFVSSLVDRVLPSGLVYMVEGDSCPPGYKEMADGANAHVSGAQPFTSIGGENTSQVGSNEHDHTGNPLATLGTVSDEFVETEVPVSAGETTVIFGIPFGSYPTSVTLDPYPGERPQTVLGTAHSHLIRTRMENIPPSFPVKFCKKL